MSLSRYFDRVAIALSAVCIVHCLAVPFVVVLLPVVALSIGENGHFHALMLWLVVPTSVAGFALGYKVHFERRIVLLGSAGVLLLALAALWGHDRWPAALEILVTIAGSIVLAYAHWLNFREVRRLHHHG
jgi:hypothetical protein